MKRNLYIMAAVVLMIMVDASGYFTYLGRSIIKVIIFGLVPYILLRKNHDDLPTLEKDHYFKHILIFSIVIVISVLVAAYILNHFGMLSLVKDSLSSQVGVNPDNYPFVFIYIIFINGPLEEFFFRHFTVKKPIISSFLFSIYHVGMLWTMFPWYIFGLSVLGLVLVGYIFILMNTKRNSILNSITLHMSANLAINLVGWMIIMK